MTNLLEKHGEEARKNKLHGSTCVCVCVSWMHTVRERVQCNQSICHQVAAWSLRRMLLSWALRTGFAVGRLATQFWQE